MDFFLELFVNGLLTGVLYSLLALGLVLVYKASSVLNLAVGEMALLASFVVALAASLGAPVWLAILAGIVAMVAFGYGVERLVFRPLIAQPVISLIMATVGIALFLRGVYFVLSHKWPIYIMDMGIPADAIHVGAVSILGSTLVGALAGLALFGIVGYLFARTRTGLALRGVSDDQRVALSLGISIYRLWAIVWMGAGLVALVGGIIWGQRIGVQFGIAILGLKGLPVVFLGGLDSMAGAILAGVFIGVAENVVAGYLDPLIGGGTKEFLPFFVMLIALWVRPYGFFGREIIERV
ncbi:MAG: branched-chain amino acid ABC transporter permease [Anaerolineae bacterium]